MDVPADGNCMVWALRTLSFGLEHCKKYPNGCGRTSVKDCAKIRSVISAGWRSVKGNMKWEALFESFCADRLVEEAPVTPQKKQKKSVENLNGKENGAEFQTPERPGLPFKRIRGKQAAEKIGYAAAVPISKNAAPPSPGLKKPRRKRRANWLEPAVPDLEEDHYKIMMSEKKVSDPNDIDVDQMDAEMLDSDPEERRERVRKKRRCTRQWKSRRKSLNEIRSAILIQKLALLGLSYNRFMEIHRVRAVIKKAWVCKDEGGWNAFKQRMSKGEMPPNCDSCIAMLAELKLGEAEVQNFGEAMF